MLRLRRVSKWFLQVIIVSSKTVLMVPSSFRIEIGNSFELLLSLCIPTESNSFQTFLILEALSLEGRPSIIFLLYVYTD